MQGILRGILFGIKKANARNTLVLAVIAAFSVVGYLLASALTYRVGFPLDDAWIHQTYARNLALSGEWSFLPGQPSAGSTSPLWSALLALGYLFHLAPFGWSWLLGFALLWAIGIAGMRIFQTISPNRSGWSIWVGIFLLTEWHLAWSAVSGMETTLLILILLVVLVQLMDSNKSWLGTGCLIGLSVWVRPDGLTLLGPALLTLMLVERGWRRRIRSAIEMGAGFSLLFGLYLLWNRLLGGNWWPNTFYAKQTEYAIELQDTLWHRILEQAMQPLVGAGVLLFPAFILSMFEAGRERRWGALAGGLWAIGFLLLYALRLPVTYQHGRYVMPMMPVYFIWGLAGMAKWCQSARLSVGARVVSRAWMLATALVALAFWIMGARAYGRDVAFIESEMVVTARWVAANTESQAIIAAHDIGALGYYGKRTLVDLAGLITPEVIPIIRDEVQLKAYLDSHQVDYLVTFPSWYPHLVEGLQPLFLSGGSYSQAFDGENMAVYRWDGQRQEAERTGGNIRGK